MSRHAIVLHRAAITVVVLSAVLPALAPIAAGQALREYEGLESDRIVQIETELLGAYARSVLPQCGDREAAVEALTWIVAEREFIGASLHRVYPLDLSKGITAADAIDDSLSRYFEMIGRRYVEAAGPPSYADSTGALSVFRARIAESPGVGDVPVPYATVAAVRFGRDALVAARATGLNVAAAEDAFARYVAGVGRKYIEARNTLKKRHLAEIQNEDWVLARLRCAECSAQDWEVGALFMKIKKGSSDYYHTRDLTCRSCGSIYTWDYFLPSFTLMNKLGIARLPGEPADSTDATILQKAP